MAVEFVTKEDLQRLRLQLLNDMARMLADQRHTAKEINWLTAKEVSRRLQISYGTITQLRRSGKIPFKKIGKQYRYNCD